MIMNSTPLCQQEQHLELKCNVIAIFYRFELTNRFSDRQMFMNSTGRISWPGFLCVDAQY